MLHFANASIDFGCGSFIVSGTADAASATLTGIADFSLAGGVFLLGAGTLSLGGDFSDAGTFTPGTGTVAVGDACGKSTSTFQGTNAFYTLAIATSVGKQVVFPVGLTQNVAHALVLQGTARGLLRIASTSAGRQGVFALATGASQRIGYVDARDNRASAMPIAPGSPSLYHSINDGDLTHWFDTSGGDDLAATPTLGRFAMLLLAALLAGFAAKRRRTCVPRACPGGRAR